MDEILSQISLADILFVIIIAAIIIFLVKKMIGLAIGVVAIFLLFQIGFMFAGDDMTNLIGKYVGPETAESIGSFFDDFAARRDENAIVDTDAVYDDMKGVLNTGIEVVKDVFTPENIKTFSSSLADVLKEAGYDDITMDELVNVIADEIGTTPDDEVVQEIANEVMNNLETQ